MGGNGCQFSTITFGQSCSNIFYQPWLMMIGVLGRVDCKDHFAPIPALIVGTGYCRDVPGSRLEFPILFWSQRIYNGGRICYIRYVFMVPY